MTSTISLRRGLDWVSTGLYDPTIFNPATDYVAKYTLASINGDTAAYKAKVYLVTGTQNQYCIQHTDGTIYVLDGYDPFDCVYYMHWFRTRAVYSSTAGFSARSMSVDRFMVMPNNFVTCPLAGGNNSDTRTDSLNTYQGPFGGTDPVCSSLSTYVVDGNGNKQLFTQYYYDPANGVPSRWTGIEYIPAKHRAGINSANSVQFESAAYHRLFFQDEPFTFLNVDPRTDGLESLVTSGQLTKTHTSSVSTYPPLGRNGVDNDGNWSNMNSVFASTKSLNFLIPSASAPYSSDPLAGIYGLMNGRGNYGQYDPYNQVRQSFAIDPYYQYYTCFQADVTGCYTNADGVRVNLIEAGYIPSTPLFESQGYPGDPVRFYAGSISTSYVSNRYYASQKPASFNAGSTIGTLTPIAFPTKELPSPTISLRNLPAPVAQSTGINLVKGVDYVLTGIYSPADFPANSIVVKCKINGAYVKLAVSKASNTIFTVRHNNQNYILDGFDPFEVYYTLIPQAGNFNYVWTMQKDKTNSRMMRTFDKYPHYASRIKPVGYSTSGTYNVLNNPIKYFYTATSGTTTQFSHFSFDSTGDMTIQHGGELFLFDPATIQIANPVGNNVYTSFTPTTQTRSAQYHELFLAGEKCKAYNCTPDNMGNVYSDGRPTVASVTDFLYCTGYPQDFYFDDARTLQHTLYGSTYFGNTNVGGININGLSAEFLECSITLEPSMAYRSFGGFHAFNGFAYQASPNNLFPEINYGNTYFIATRISVPSPAGLYVDASGNRFDVVQLTNYGGFYTCVESLENRVSNTDAWRNAHSGLRCILDNLPTVDLLASTTQALSAASAQIATLQAQIAASTTQIATLQAQVDSLDPGALAAAQAQIATLQASIEADNAEIALLEAQLSASSTAVIAFNLFGVRISISEAQAIGAGILAGAAAVIYTIIYFGPIIFRG